MNARERILAKLRAAAPATVPDRPDVAGYYGGRTAPDLARQVTQLAAQLRTVHAEVHIVGAEDWPDVAARLLVERQVRRLLHEANEATAGQLVARLPAGIEAVPFAMPLETWKSELIASVDAAYSLADGGIAATGTLIFSSAPTRPRSLSLVPPVHLALLRAETLHANLQSAATARQWSADMPSNLILVSGPSKTSDIQQTVAYGAHGPRELIVLVEVPEALREELQ